MSDFEAPKKKGGQKSFRKQGGPGGPYSGFGVGFFVWLPSFLLLFLGTIPVDGFRAFLSENYSVRFLIPFSISEISVSLSFFYPFGEVCLLL